MSQSLAILGGQPVRTRPFTSWPIFGESEEQRLLHPRSVKYKQRRQKPNSYQFSSHPRHPRGRRSPERLPALSLQPHSSGVGSRDGQELEP